MGLRFLLTASTSSAEWVFMYVIGLTSDARIVPSLVLNLVPMVNRVVSYYYSVDCLPGSRDTIMPTMALLTQPCAEINSCDFLFLKQISELDHSGLRLILEEAAANPETTSISVGNTQITDCHRVEPTTSSRIFEIVWDHYVAYSVRNESFARGDEQDVSAGRTFRIYSRSRFLDFIGYATFVSDGYPGPVQHICIGCEDHIIDVVSTQGPWVTCLWPPSK